MSTQISENNKRIAKNAIYLYLRMFFSMAVSLYTGRVVLATLGVMDYGIWNVVAGVIGMFSFLNASMAGCTNRFLSFEIGKKDEEGLQKVFSASLSVHLIIALVVFLGAETIGLWFLQEKLVIPADRVSASFFIYQVAVISSIVGIIEVPFRSMIMANEKMNVYAYVEILNTSLRLIIVYILTLVSFDKLKTYGVLNVCVGVSIFAIYFFYCNRNLRSCKTKLSLDKSIVKPMLGFSVWDLYGNASVVMRTQGVNMLLNMFFTATMNAASAVATSVQNAVMAFARNVLTAFRPQIVKTYAEGNHVVMVDLIRKASILTTFLLLIFTIPLLIETDYVLTLWLKNPPEYAAILCRWVLIFNVIANLSTVLVSGVHATGYIKRSSFVNGTFYLLVIPFSYVAYRYALPAEVAFVFNVVAVCCGMAQNAFVLSKYVVEFKKKVFFRDVVFKYTIVFSIDVLVVLCCRNQLEEGFFRLIVVSFLNVFLLSFLTVVFVANREERCFLLRKIKSLYSFF